MVTTSDHIHTFRQRRFFLLGICVEDNQRVEVELVFMQFVLFCVSPIKSYIHLVVKIGVKMMIDVKFYEYVW
jgi:hypothetical protein